MTFFYLNLFMFYMNSSSALKVKVKFAGSF